MTESSLPAGIPRRHTAEAYPNNRLRADQSPLPCPTSGSRLVDRWTLYDQVKQIRRELGLTDRDLAVLHAHLTALPKGPVDTGRPVYSYMSAANLRKRACDMDERKFRRGEVALEEAGLLRRVHSANRRRFPVREVSGEVGGAFGIHLTPFFESADWIQAKVEETRQNAVVQRNLRSSLRARLSALAKAARDGGFSLPSAIRARIEEIQRIVRRQTVTAREMATLERDAEELSRATTSLLDRHEDASDHRDDGSCAPLPPALPEVWPDRTAGRVGQYVRPIESIQKESPDCAERKAFQSIAAAWGKSPRIRDLYPATPRNGDELGRCLFEFSSFLRIDERLCHKAIATFGLHGVVEALDYLAERLTSLRNPGGYLASMITNFEAGRAVAAGRVIPVFASRASQKGGE